MKLIIITEKCSPFSDTVSHKIDHTAFTLHKDHPPA